MGDEPRRDGTTSNMRIFRTFLDDKSRPTRIDHELRAIDRQITNAADLTELQGGDPAFLRQLGKMIRDYAAQQRSGGRP
jgi:hypothetical protein